jgi:vitamin B12 transporter
MATLSKRRAALAAGVSLLSILSQLDGARAQDAQATPPSDFQALGDIEVTATRTEQPVAQSASAITVIPAAEIEKRGASGLADVLRGTPGLDLSSYGGIGTSLQVSLRGATPAQTLILIDGIRIGDQSSTSGAPDLGAFSANNIERIEVLRGPQSALYGSDAMGGVINIITRPGEGPARGSALVEGGSYGTIHSRVEQSGASGDWTYSFALDGLHTNAFPRFGYRIPAPFAYLGGAKGLAPAIIEPTNRAGASAQLGYRVNEDVRITAGFTGHHSGMRFDNPWAMTEADTFAGFNRQLATFAQGFARIDDDSFDKRLHSRLTVFANQNHRDYWQTESCHFYGPGDNCKNAYQAARFGAEYQGDLKLGPLGLLTFGGKTETETMRNTSQADPTAPQLVSESARQTTNSLFAQHQFTLFDRLDLSAGGRVDSIVDGKTFATWRTTAAYRLEETGTKLRASGGTGARNPSLFERFSPWGNRNLQPEESIGYDVGVDQRLADGRVLLSATYFDNDYKNLITASLTSTDCLAGYYCDYNVNRARTRGVETSGEVWVAPETLRVRASYTYLDARDLTTGARIPLRPYNKGALSALYTGVPNLEIEARATFVGATTDTSLVLPAYAKYDVFANYRVNAAVSVFGRLENLTDARYQERAYYGVPGRSVYGGVKYEW